jgi:uncharacterized membrane protein YccC
MDPSGLWLVAIVALLQFAIEVVITRNYALALIFITPLARVNSGAAGPDNPLVLAGERMVDTLLGAGTAMAVLWTGEWVRAQRHG